MSDEQFDLTVIGGGPGGYVCAIRASQLGLRTAIIEKRPTMGGTCVNVGCIPSKALLDSSERFEKAGHDFADHGIQLKDLKIDIKQMMKRKERVVKELTDGLKFLMDKNKITVFQGHGSFSGKEGDSFVLKCDGKTKSTFQSKKVVIATGSEVIRLPGIEIDGKQIITSDEAIALEEVPEHLVVMGGGVIGLELGSVWKRLGARVTVIELMPGILWGMDRQTRELAQRTFQKQGLEFLLEQKVTGAEVKKKKVTVKVESADGKKKSELECDRLLVCVGRKPYTESLGLDKVGVKVNERGRVDVDDHLQTNIPGIYAIGDVIRGPMLAHKAEEEGVMVAEVLAGKPGHVNYNAIPSVVYTWPEVASVGRGEEELKEAGIEYKVGKYMFRPNGRAKAMNESDGQVKVIADKKTDRVLGVFIVGPNASELIAEAAIAIEFGASSEDIARTCHAHPTLAEVLKEAAMAVDNRAIHG